jgi:DnaJ-class molecular chaperone
LIKSSVDRDERKGRCSACNGYGKAYTISSSYKTTCQSCDGTGKYRPY